MYNVVDYYTEKKVAGSFKTEEEAMKFINDHPEMMLLIEKVN